MEAQLRTDPLIQSEENQRASGTKNWLNLLTLFSGEGNTPAHQPTRNQEH